MPSGESESRKRNAEDGFEATEAPKQARTVLWDAVEVEPPEAFDPRQYLAGREKACRVDRRFLSRHENRGVKSEHRARIVNWLSSVVASLRLETGVLHYAVGYMDRYCAHEGVELDTYNYHEISAAALKLAVSFYSEDGNVPSETIARKMFLSVGETIRDATVAMRKRVREIFVALGGEQLSFPTSLEFAYKFAKTVGYTQDPQLMGYVRFVCETMLYITELAHLPGSILGAVAVTMTRRLMREKHPYPKDLMEHAGYSWAEIKPVLSIIETFVKTWPSRLEHEVGGLRNPATLSKFARMVEKVVKRASLDAVRLTLQVDDHEKVIVRLSYCSRKKRARPEDDGGKNNKKGRVV